MHVSSNQSIGNCQGYDRPILLPFREGTLFNSALAVSRSELELEVESDVNGFHYVRWWMVDDLMGRTGFQAIGSRRLGTNRR